MFCVQAHGLLFGLVLSCYVPRPLLILFLLLSSQLQLFLSLVSPYHPLVFAVLCRFIEILTCVLPYLYYPTECIV